MFNMSVGLGILNLYCFFVVCAWGGGLQGPNLLSQSSAAGCLGSQPPSCGQDLWDPLGAPLKCPPQLQSAPLLMTFELRFGALLLLPCVWTAGETNCYKNTRRQMCPSCPRSRNGNCQMSCSLQNRKAPLTNEIAMKQMTWSCNAY